MGSGFWVTRKLGTMSIEDVSEPGVIVLDVRDLEDGRNPPWRIVAKLIMGDYIIREGGRLMVRCHAGVSRSNTIAACIVAYQTNVSFDDALDFVKRKVPRAMPNMDIQDSAKAALVLLKRNLGY